MSARVRGVSASWQIALCLRGFCLSCPSLRGRSELPTMLLAGARTSAGRHEVVAEGGMACKGVTQRGVRWGPGLPGSMAALGRAPALQRASNRRGSWRDPHLARLLVSHSSRGSTTTGEPAPSRKVGKTRLRLDEACMAQYPEHSRSLIQSWIMQGKVLVDGQPVTKAGAAVKSGAKVEVIAKQPKYVCRAGYKLEGALDAFGVDVGGRVALDAGLSTGGFTDCLLQRGARRVYGVDVGYGQVHDKIRVDERVVVMERTNLRYLTGESIPEKVDLVTLDLSFISLLLVMPAVLSVAVPEALLITLIKPQFEARRDQVGGGGIIRSTGIRQEVVLRVLEGMQQHGLQLHALRRSPITGTDGNVEYLALFSRSDQRPDVDAGLGHLGAIPLSFFEATGCAGSLVSRRGDELVVVPLPDQVDSSCDLEKKDTSSDMEERDPFADLK